MMKTTPPTQASLFPVKRVEFLGRDARILMQQENGPCPLLAVANVLLLRGQLELPSNSPVISSDVLVELLAGKLLDLQAKHVEKFADTRHAVDDVLKLLPSLVPGLDVNCKFCGVTQFEYTSAIAVFDVFSVTLYHGWVIDPQDKEFGSMVDLSYNAMVERALQTSSDDALVSANAELAQHFLHSTSSQMTYTGLAMLHEQMKTKELAVLFRNNHFSTVYKHDSGVIYVLCSDSSFLNRPAICWEKISDLDGDTEFLSPLFESPNGYLLPGDRLANNDDNLPTASAYVVVPSAKTLSSSSGEVGDAQQPTMVTWGSSNDDADTQLAMQLQREEEQLANARERQPAPVQQQQQQSRQQPPASSSCTVS